MVIITTRVPGARRRMSLSASRRPGSEVHQHHIRCVLQGQLQCLLGVAGLGNKLHVGKPLQRRARPARTSVIVDDENSHRHATDPCRESTLTC